MFKDQLCAFIRNNETQLTYDKLIDWARQHGTLRVRKNRKGQAEINLSGNGSWEDPIVWCDNHELMLIDQLEACLKRYGECLGEGQLTDFVVSRLLTTAIAAGTEDKRQLDAKSVYTQGVIDGIRNRKTIASLKNLPGPERSRELRRVTLDMYISSGVWKSKQGIRK